MSCTEVRSDDTTGDAGARTVDMKFEVVTIPAVDVVCATALYRSLGWREDVEPRARRDQVLHEAHVGRILPTAAAGHDEHERRRVAEHDVNWPSWYAAYTVVEQSGAKLPE
jgi:hypothetical protein